MKVARDDHTGPSPVAIVWHVLVPVDTGPGPGRRLVLMLLLNREGWAGLMTALGVLVWLTEMLLIGVILQALMVPLGA